MIEENNLKEEFAKDFPNSWGRRSVNPTSWLKKKEINIPNPAEKGCIIYIDNDGNEISREYGRQMKDSLNNKYYLSISIYENTVTTEVESRFVEEYTDLITKYNLLLVMSDSDIVNFKNNLITLINNYFK